MLNSLKLDDIISELLLIINIDIIIEYIIISYVLIWKKIRKKWIQIITIIFMLLN